MWLAVVVGIVLAILFASALFPLLWKPPKDGGRKGPQRK